MVLHHQDRALFRRLRVAAFAFIYGMVSGNMYRPSSSATLIDGEWYTYLLEACCIHTHADNPQTHGQYTLVGPPDDRLRAIIGAASGAGSVATTVLQATIWAVTDNVTAGQLTDVGYGLAPDQIASVQTPHARSRSRSIALQADEIAPPRRARADDCATGPGEAGVRRRAE